MKDFLTFLLKNIVDQPEAISVKETIDDLGVKNFSLSVSPADMGKVIGRAGKIIKAIRHLALILAIKENVRINVILKEE
jgi:predicted RNA-binding protein YlqC (UPF0109 family)